MKVTKMAESYCFHTKAVSYLPGSFLFQENFSKQNFNLDLKVIFPVNPLISSNVVILY